MSSLLCVKFEKFIMCQDWTFYHVSSFIILLCVKFTNFVVCQVYVNVKFLITYACQVFILQTHHFYVKIFSLLLDNFYCHTTPTNTISLLVKITYFWYMSSFVCFYFFYANDFFLCTVTLCYVKFHIFMSFFIFYICHMIFLHVPLPYVMSIFIQLFLFCTVLTQIFMFVRFCQVATCACNCFTPLCQVFNLFPLFDNLLIKLSTFLTFFLCVVKLSTLSSCQLFPFVLSSLTTVLSSCQLS